MKRLLSNAFTILLVVFLLTAGIFLFLFPKEEGHLYLNGWHNSALDLFFSWITFMGDGIFVSIIVLLLLFTHFKNALILLTCFLGTALFTQFLKRIIYPDALRPVKFFDGKADLYLVEGVDIHFYNSFPSGHATSAFALFFCLALMTKNRFLQSAFFFLALFASISRVYLSQHFLEDIFAGAIIGSSITLILFHWMNKALPHHTSRPLHYILMKK